MAALPHRHCSSSCRAAGYMDVLRASRPGSLPFERVKFRLPTGQGQKTPLKLSDGTGLMMATKYYPVMAIMGHHGGAPICQVERCVVSTEAKP